MCAWNTVYLHEIQSCFARTGAIINEELWQHVSLARWKHIKMLDHYTFDVGLAHSLDNLRPPQLNPPDREKKMD